MANNPYSQPQTLDNLPPEPRVSALAVCSLVFGLVCCIPGSGLLATILGGAGMVRISKSEGRLSGRTLSFIGLALGILSTTLWLALVVGAGQAVSAFKTRVFLPTQTDLQALEKGDWATARKLLDSKVSAKVSDEQLKKFRDEVGEKFGTFVGIPTQIDWNKMLNQQPNIQQTGVHTMLPFPVDFKNGQAWVIVVTDSAETIPDILWSGKSIDGTASNIGVVGEGKEVWLVDPASKVKSFPFTTPTPKPPEAPKPPETPEAPSGG